MCNNICSTFKFINIGPCQLEKPHNLGEVKTTTTTIMFEPSVTSSQN